MKSEDLIDDLIVQATSLPGKYDEVQLDSLIRRTELVIRKLFGAESHYFEDLNKIKFKAATQRIAVSGSYDASGQHRFPRQSTPTTDAYWVRGVSKLKNLLTVMKEDLELASSSSSTSNNDRNGVYYRKVFVVHGHDEEMKQSVARVLSQLEMEPIILHEQPNRGHTIIEKFDQHSDVGFAIVLLSPDDVGRKKSEDSSKDKPRARQNVVFELGYFIGKLGRARVIPLLRSSGDFEKPTDIDGVAYVSYDANGAWKFEVAKELSACGYAIDANKLLNG